jgi:hypothetical protein
MSRPPAIANECQERRAVLSLETGSIMVVWPSALTHEDIQDIEALFAILLRTIRRADRPPSAQAEPAATRTE